MMNKILFVSDLHLNLETDGVDRTAELVRVVKKDVFTRADNLKKVGHNVNVVFGGDIFNKNTPSEVHIAAFIQIINMFSGHGIHLYIMSGNHDSISDKRLSCLSFIKKLSEVYDYVSVVNDIKTIRYKTTDAGIVYLIFLPHINNAHLEKSKYKTTQEYIDRRVEDIYKKLGNGVQTIVFTHLDIKGSIAGDESNLLRKSTVNIPSTIIDNTDDKILPTIVSGHNHKHQIIGNINIVGCPIYTDFSDCGEAKKYVGEITLPNNIQGSTTVDFHETSCIPFVQLDVVSENKGENIADKILKKANGKLSKVKNGFLKIDLTVYENELTNVDLEKIELLLHTRYGYTTKKIVPKVIRNRVSRNKDLQIGIDKGESLTLFMKKDKSLKSKDKSAITVYAEKYFEQL